ncbi:KxYKxGKxW signal peptide domain-containing protein, partial [Apilactobacillus kunkeei]
MKKEVKEKKVLHKVKKNWVVIGMTSVTLLGACYVASQNIDATSTSVVAHADVIGKVSDIANINANIINISGNHVSSTNSANFTVSITNKDPFGNYIPAGTKIVMNFDGNGNDTLNNTFNYKTYTNFNQINPFTVSNDGKKIIFTTTRNLYPGTYNINLSLTAKRVGEDGGNAQNTDSHSVNYSTDLSYNGANSNISKDSLIVTPGGKNNPESGTVPTQVWNIPMYKKINPSGPDDSSNWDVANIGTDDYPQSGINENFVNLINGDINITNYAPAVTGKNGKLYFPVVLEYHGADDNNSTAYKLIMQGGLDNNLNNYRLFTIENGKYVDITHEPGINISIDSSDTVTADVSQSNYKDKLLDFVGFSNYTDLTSVNYVHTWLERLDKNGNISSYFQQTETHIVPVPSNKSNSWIVAPTLTVYTDENGKAKISDGSLINGVSVYKTTNNGFTPLDASHLSIDNSNDVDSSDGVNVQSDSTNTYEVSYKVDGNSTPVKRTVYVINPYKEIHQNATLTATVKYVDEETGASIYPEKSSSVTYSSDGLNDSRDGSTEWNGWTITNGQKDYSINTPQVNGYKLVNDSDRIISGTLDVNGSNVSKTVLMKKISDDSGSLNSAESSNAQSSSAESSSAQSSSAESSSAQSSSAESSSTQSSSAESSSAQSSSAESSSVQSSSAESSSVQSSSAESSSAQSSSAESSSAQSSSAESSSAQSSSAESSSAQSSS